MSRCLILLPDRNTPGKQDFGGAFLPESQQFARIRKEQGWDVRSVLIDLGASKPLRAAQVFAALDPGKGEPWGCIAIFAHGLRSGLPQFGIGLNDVGHMASLMASTKLPGIVVPIYACSTANGDKPSKEGEPGGDGGFADRLRDALCAAGSIECTVDAHATAGHATWNPHVRRFLGAGTANGGIGGKWIVAPGSPLWKSWVKALRPPGDLRFRFPWLTTNEIEEELKA